ncbi:DNA-binding transcriptional response regulator [Sulfurimonas gotlandica]|uniref:Fis family transcriptional regulator n=1 Tax=Sulfurimonas gotlandica TaxID=1176482 RepID=UPI0021CFD389|nr:Fis family transcriptional regulator [Sulfurimonas gotlandica]
MALVVDATSFITASEPSAQAFKTATLLKTLSVNSLISGEVGVGKKTLARYILPDAIIIEASDFDELLSTLESVNEIIIINLENSPNIKRVVDAINVNSVRVVATSKSSFSNEYIDEIFSVKFDIPPLRDRLEDVEELVVMFINEASSLFCSNTKFNTKNFTPDLSQNSNSLKRQVMIHSLLQDIKDVELMDIVENYLVDKLGSQSDYRNFLHLYEVPLIKAGLSRFKSQLQLSDKLGLNRNTLRKKIADNKEYL